MISRARKTVLFAALVALPLTAFAQEATLSGTVMVSNLAYAPRTLQLGFRIVF